MHPSTTPGTRSAAAGGPQPAAPRPLPHHVGTAVVGAGFAGLAAAAALVREGGRDVVVLERADRVGGTWRDNVYPGAACDVRSDLYQLSSMLEPGWRHRYARQPEILAYLEGAVAGLGLTAHLHLGTEVLEAAWDDEAALWRLRTDRGDLTAEVLVVGAGPLVLPRWPAVPGLGSFGGPLLHTARWDPTVDLSGRRVGVVGTGASAAQLVPAVAGTAAHVTVFQRSAPWVFPRGDGATSAARRALFRRVPALQRLSGARVFARNELAHLGLAHRRVGALVEHLLLRRLDAQVRDPDLRRRLRPTYRLGCKRVVVSDEWYRTLDRPDVTLVDQPVVAVTSTGVRTADGAATDLDVLVCGTGFVATEPPVAALLRGRDGRTLAEHWADGGMQALRGTTVTGFPNLFLLLGPHTLLGHNSVVHVAESQVEHLVQLLRAAAADAGPGRRPVVEATPEAQSAWTERMRVAMARSVWTTGGCTSFYLDAEGRSTVLWPHRAAQLRRELRGLRRAEHSLRTVPA